MWWSGVGEEEAFYNPVIRSQASVSLSPWAVIFTGACDSSLHPHLSEPPPPHYTLMTDKKVKVCGAGYFPSLRSARKTLVR